MSLSTFPTQFQNVSGTPARPLADAEMATTYEQLLTDGNEVLIVANKFTSAMYARARPEVEWKPAGSGEFADACIAEVSANVRKKRTFWATTTNVSPQSEDPAGLALVLAKKQELVTWLKGSEQVTGRFGHASLEVKKEVAYHAANRCQFSGCGKDLGMHTVTGAKGTFSYFAHIVAASADGPRGDPVESEKLVNDPTNFLLLCDECHRLVDKVDPAKYTVARLREMRLQSIQDVRRALSTLQYPDADVLCILGNVTGQSPHISERDIDDSLWKSRLRRSPLNIEYCFSFGGAHHKPHDQSYWSAAFSTLPFDLVMLQARLNGVRTGGTSRRRLAVYPLHGTSVLILAGRLLGDMAGTHVFQPHRNKVGEHLETRWAWPDNIAAPAPDKFKVDILEPFSFKSTEANLLVALSAPIASARLATASSTRSTLSLPTIAISVDQFGHSTIRHPSDLTLLGAALDEALRTLQDSWRIKTVHLYVCAPTSAALLVGQKMQARHQANFICYESLPGENMPYAPTIEISSQDVKVVGSNLTASLQT